MSIDFKDQELNAYSPESVLAASFDQERKRTPLITDSGQTELKNDGKNWLINWKALSPFSLHQYAYAREEREFGVYTEERFPVADEETDKALTMRLLLKHLQIVGVLIDLKKQAGTTVMDFCLTPVGHHGCVLGAAYEAGIDKKLLVNAGDCQILLPSSSHLRSEQRLGVWLEFGYDNREEQFVNRFEVMTTREPLIPAEKFFLKKQALEMVKAMKVVLPGVSERIAKFWWPSLEQRKVLADIYKFHSQFTEGRKITDNRIDSQTWRY